MSAVLSLSRKQCAKMLLMVVYSVIEDIQQILVDISWQLATHQIKIRKPTYIYHNCYYVILVYTSGNIRTQ